MPHLRTAGRVAAANLGVVSKRHIAEAGAFLKENFNKDVLSRLLFGGSSGKASEVLKDLPLEESSRLLGKRGLKANRGLSSLYAGGIKAAPIINLITAGMTVSQIYNIMGIRSDRKKVEASTTSSGGIESSLRAMRQKFRLAAAEARLAKKDPDAYAALQRAMTGRKVPPLGPSEFAVGGPAPRQVTSEDMQRALSGII